MVQWLRLCASTWNSAQCYVAAWMGEGFGGEWKPVYVQLSPFDVHLKLPQNCLSIGHTPIQNKKLKKKKKDSASTERGEGSTPGWKTKILSHDTTQPGKKKKKPLIEI